MRQPHSQQPHPRADAPRRRSNLLPALLVVGLLVVVAVVLLFVSPGFLRPAPQSAQQQAVEAEISPEATTAAEVDSSAQSTTAQGAYDPTGDPRNAEFAVDPQRVTDWNYGSTGQKMVWLTFDDGPSENTQAVLDILDRYGIKATFFVTGINPEYFPMIRESYARGHTIGLHTYSHEYDQVYASLDAYWDDLGRIGDAVREQIGYVPCFIRFPGGSSNTISANYTPGIMSALSQQVLDAGYQYYDWDASCGDGAEHTADELVAATEADTSYGYENIVFLMHDGAGKATTVEALPRIIEYFQREGYSFAALDRQAHVPHHGIGN